MRTGSVRLPLHYGKAPAWLFNRMKLLAREMTLAIVKEQSSKIFLDKISDPFWFQAFGCALGFDWHSSGLTTTVCGALKEGLKDVSNDIGIFVCGGKGGTSRKTPREIEDIGHARKIKVAPENLVYASKMTAKVDSAALQDGYQLYQHNFIFDTCGNWVVVQQGMNTETKWARRYHWSGEGLESFVSDPHKAVCCDYRGEALNMVAGESEKARSRCVEVVLEGEKKAVKDFLKTQELKLPRHHHVSLSDIRPENLSKILLRTYEKRPKDFESLLILEGVGPKTVRALALISELIYGEKPSFKDPVRFSFAHGGKDGHPYPVDRENYDNSIDILRRAVNEAKMGRSEKLKALRRLSSFLCD